MSHGMRRNFFQGLVHSFAKSPARRQPRSSALLRDVPESLEERQVLSAIATVPLPAGWESTTSTAAVSSKANPADTPAFPNLAGTWNISLSGTADGEPFGPFSGTVTITQKKGKLFGDIQVPGRPDFTLKGKLSTENPLEFSGKTRYPFEIREDRFLKVRLNLNLTYSQDLQSFSGTIDRTIFGHEIEGTVSGNKVV